MYEEKREAESLRFIEEIEKIDGEPRGEGGGKRMRT